MRSILARLRFRLGMWLFVLALGLFGLAIPGSWLAGTPVGLAAGALLVHIVRKGQELDAMPPSRLGTIVCHAAAAAFTLPLLIVIPSILQAMRRGNGVEETLLGVSLGFFLYLVFRFIRWGRAQQFPGASELPAP